MPVYKDEKTNTWYFSCYYKDWQGQQRRKLKRGFALQREAKEAERKFLELYRQNASMSFAAFYEIYLDHCKQKIKPSTIKTKNNIFTHRILPYFGNMPLNSIKADTIRRWQNELTQQNLSQYYIKSVNTQLKTIFNFAVKYEYLVKNPTKSTDNIGKTTKSIRFWTLKEFKQNIKLFTGVHYTVLSLLFYTGMRIGELLALTIGDYDRTAKTITINKTYTKIDNLEIVQTPKTENSIRKIIVPTAAAALLENYLDTIPAPKPNQRIFEQIKIGTLEVAFAREQKRAGLDPIRLHDLRHSHASLLIHLNINILAISERLGHKNPNITLAIYGHLYKENRDEIAEKLNNL